ncbi:MAG: cytochrome c [Saprospiraceae bacterium]|nr:cytochrome c [Saprospiraceae bacterium]MCF8248996.1 cytochrome c [Saprospiraceae bacterium]MCF8279207.1 cytochrome c [Bacteroidales bacterium]MCF8310890.1 cytochrome c [Saprospiraceae bacterium]MCF8439522.1 cytochrome c [Saprospiraceae bacterium]
MKNFQLLSIFFGLLLTAQAIAQNGSETEALFKTKCAICHTIGKGKLVGPDLANVHDRQTEEWMLKFIKSSQSLIKSGDSTAVALFEANNKMVMPDPMISDDEIRTLLSYIKENSGGAGVAEPYVSIIKDATSEDLQNGKSLFEGRKRLANGGPSCITCHNGLANTFFNENSYSKKDLSASFANLGEQGVRAILENPPYPVMKQAFAKEKIAPQEVHDLLVFISSANAGSTVQAQSNLPSGFLLYGLLGAGALIILYSGFWYGRKSRSVNQSIYKRQIKSIN